MKKLINDPRAVVSESLQGLAAAHGDLVTVHAEPDFITRTGGPRAGKVGLVSGGGSGHEPLHGGFVGEGMLDAAVPGPGFTSPTPDPIVAGTLAVDGGAGGRDSIPRAVGRRAGKVGLVGGGGSGHERLHGGFVGEGMLDAAVPGPVFTSPTPDPIVAATLAVDGGAGVLHIVKNYTGDVLNFETAADLAAAEDIQIRSVLVADDVAVKDSL